MGWEVEPLWCGGVSAPVLIRRCWGDALGHFLVFPRESFVTSFIGGLGPSPPGRCPMYPIEGLDHRAVRSLPPTGCVFHDFMPPLVRMAVGGLTWISGVGPAARPPFSEGPFGRVGVVELWS